jgi:8-oxo-dGTP pyrophosphatase MutT (NUDIX family)
MPHIHEKIDYTVEVFIVHKNKVLLRMHDKYKIWCSVGGHIELDEDPIEAAYREVKEEVGLAITLVGPDIPVFSGKEYATLLPPRYLGRHRATPTHEHVVFIYFARADTDTLEDPVHEHERAETRWVTKEELETMDLVPNMKFYATEALKALSE